MTSQVNLELPLKLKLDEQYYSANDNRIRNVLQLIAPNSLQNMTWTIPPANTVGVLNNDGNGNLRWEPISGLGGDTIDVTNDVTTGIFKLIQNGLGDSSIRLYTPASTYLMGIDQSENNFKIAKGSSLGAGDVMIMNDDQVSFIRNNANITPQLSLIQQGLGDSSIYFNVPGDGYAVGIDQNDSNKFKISHSNTLGTNDILTLTTSGVISFPGSIILPETATDGSEGLITIGNARIAAFNASYNLYMGINAGVLTSTGIHNTSYGRIALGSISTGSFNTAIGCESGSSTSMGSWNTFLGHGAGQTNTTGTNNTCIGYGADLSVTGLSNATAIGSGAISNESNKMQFGTGISKFAFDTAIFTLDEITKLHDFYISNTLNYYIGNGNRAATGIGNTFVGNTGVSITSGSNNVLVGNAAGDAITTGSNNTMVGPFAGNTCQNGSGNTCIGYNSDIAIGSLRRTAIGYAASSLVDDGLVLGDSNVLVGIRTSSPTEALTVVGNADITGDIYVSGNVDGVNISSFKADYDAKVNQDVRSGTNPYFENMTQMNMTGFVAWSGAGSYYSLIGTTFTLLRGCTGYIKSILCTITAPQSVTITVNAAGYVYANASGMLFYTTTPPGSFYKDYVVLFAVLSDGTSTIVKKENHPYEFNTPISEFFHYTLGTVVRGTGANITPVTVPPGDGSLIEHAQVKIVADDVYEEHGLSTAISGVSPVGIEYWYQNQIAGPTFGKWFRYLPVGPPPTAGGEIQVPRVYNQPVVGITAITADSYGIMHLYVTGSDLNSSSPRYVAIIDTAEYATNVLAETTITAGIVAIPSNELADMEFAQLGYIVVRNSGANGYVYETIIEKDTFNTRTVGGGSAGSHVLLTDLNGGTFQDGGHTYLAQINVTAAQPTPNDDIDNFKNTTIWLDSTPANQDAYICVDNTNAAAIWKQITWSNLNEVKIGFGATASNYGVAIGAGAAAFNDSVVIGRGAGTSTTTGIENVCIGHDSYTVNTTGSQNAVIGVHAGNSLVTGSGNTIFGANADGASGIDYQTVMGQYATTGAVGAVSLGSWTTATNQYSIAIGSGIAGPGTAPETTGNYSIAIGQGVKSQDLGTIGIGFGSVLLTGDMALGYETMLHTTHAAGDEGYHNTAVGHSALRRLSSGYANTALGFVALQGYVVDSTRPITGYGNTALGYKSMELYNAPAIIDAIGNTTVGYQSLRFCYSGDYNVAIGYDCGFSVQTGNSNIFIGNAANGADAIDNQIAIGNMAITGAVAAICIGNVATASGVSDISIGNSADTGTGGNSIVIGANAGNSGALGDFNTVIGSNSGSKIVRGSKNTCLGGYAGGNLVGDVVTTLGYNICIGYESMYRFDTPINATTADNNIAIGHRTLWNLTTGVRNICLGYRAGDTFTTANYSICIGSDADGAPTVIDQIAIGNTAITSGTNAIAIGANITAPANAIVLGNSSNYLSVGGYGTKILAAKFQTTISDNWSDHVNSVFSSTTGASARWPDNIVAKSHNNTVGSYTATIDQEVLGEFSFWGTNSTNTNFAPGAYITGLQNGAAGTNYIPTDMLFKTSPGGTTAAIERMRITNDGLVSLGGYNTYVGSTQAVLQIVKSGVSNVINSATYSNSSPDNKSVLNFLRTRNPTFGLFTATLNDDILGELGWWGTNSANSGWLLAGSIQMIQNGAAGTNSTPADMIFNTGSGGTNITAEAMRINKNGQLTLGTSTLYDTNSRFQITSSDNWTIALLMACSTTAGRYPSVHLCKTATNTPGSYAATTNGHILGEIRFSGSTNSARTLGARILSIQDGNNTTTDYSPTKMYFSTSDGSNWYERLTITKDGNIEIGNGQLYKYISQSIGNTYAYLWTNWVSGILGGDHYNISVNYNGVNNSIPNTGFGTTLIRLSPNELKFQTGALNTAPTTIRMQITNTGDLSTYGDGSVGITIYNTASTSRGSIGYASANGHWVNFSQTGDFCLRGGTGPISIGYATTNYGIRITNSSQYWYGIPGSTGGSVIRYLNNTLFYDTSSIKYKENIKIYEENPFILLNKLIPKTFNYKAGHTDNSNMMHLGFIAEDLDLIDKQYVGYGKNGPESVNYDRLTVPLVAASKQLDNRVKTLELENNILKSTQNQLLDTIKEHELKIQQLQNKLNRILNHLNLS